MESLTNWLTRISPKSLAIQSDSNTLSSALKLQRQLKQVVPRLTIVSSPNCCPDVVSSPPHADALILTNTFCGSHSPLPLFLHLSDPCNTYNLSSFLSQHSSPILVILHPSYCHYLPYLHSLELPHVVLPFLRNLECSHPCIVNDVKGFSVGPFNYSDLNSFSFIDVLILGDLEFTTQMISKVNSNFSLNNIFYFDNDVVVPFKGSLTREISKRFKQIEKFQTISNIGVVTDHDKNNYSQAVKILNILKSRSFTAHLVYLGNISDTKTCHFIGSIEAFVVVGCQYEVLNVFKNQISFQQPFISVEEFNSIFTE
ncbi:hypothetical protein P9112_005446 [Eukaryota sp. TZLM1-RC]